MNDLRRIVFHALLDAGVAPDDRDQARTRREALAIGRRLLPGVRSVLGGGDSGRLAVARRSLGLAEPAIPRLLGFGWQQTHGLATMAGAPAPVRAEVARLGASFNLGVSLFDHVCDRFPDRRALLTTRVTPEFLQAALAGAIGTVTSTGDAAIDLLLELIVDFFVRGRALGGDEADWLAFQTLIRRMYVAQAMVTSTRRDEAGPTRQLWEELRAKSVLPMCAMAMLALLPRSRADNVRRDAVRAAAELAGEAIWILDDLADIGEDWAAGCWSRPLWLLARLPGEASPADAAVARVIETGIATAEAGRLAELLTRLRRLTPPYGSGLLRSVNATVCSWLDWLPGEALSYPSPGSATPSG